MRRRRWAFKGWPRFFRDANCSAEPYDGEPAVCDHAAHHALGNLPKLDRAARENMTLAEQDVVISGDPDPLPAEWLTPEAAERKHGQSSAGP
jgi:hypothetical protein